MTDYTRFLVADTVAIFLFHGVIREQRYAIRNYTRKHLVLDQFVPLLEALRTAGVPVSLPDIVAAHRNGTALPERAFAVTFDDGFENNFSIAAPVLAEKDIPATFYVTTGFIEENAPSWIDMIEYAVEKSDRASLVLPLTGSLRTCTAWQQKIDLLDEIRRLVKSNPHIDPYAFAADVQRQLGVTEMTPDPDLDQKMTWDQVQQLSRNPLFTIGGHGCTHRILEYLEQSELEYEIATSLEKLRAHVGIPIAHYSYPEGLAHCYSDRVIAVLRRHGIVCAPSAVHGTNRVGDDLFHLKRVMVL